VVVRIAEEEAVIVWDPATKTEHFIRRAAFHSTARQFGFLVPTTPRLTEVSDVMSSRRSHSRSSRRSSTRRCLIVIVLVIAVIVVRWRRRRS
jgi:hypothetical protein